MQRYYRWEWWFAVEICAILKSDLKEPMPRGTNVQKWSGNLNWKWDEKCNWAKAFSQLGISNTWCCCGYIIYIPIKVTCKTFSSIGNSYNTHAVGSRLCFKLGKFLGCCLLLWNEKYGYLQSLQHSRRINYYKCRKE